MPDPWEIKGTRPIADCRVFRVSGTTTVHPLSGVEREMYVIESPDWVNVIALTPRREVVLIRQFRHGTRSITLEIPGGLIEPGEEPMAAGLRELREETGHAGRARPLGWCQPNPAIQDNRCWFVVVEDAELVGPPDLDEGEDIEVVTCPLDAIPDLIREGDITHALVVAAFHRLGMESPPTG